MTIAVEQVHIRLLSSGNPVMIEVIKKEENKVLLRSGDMAFWAHADPSNMPQKRFWAKVEMSGNRLIVRPLPYRP